MERVSALPDGVGDDRPPDAARRWLGGTQKAHYGLDEQPTEPVQADWLLGAFLFLRREMLDELGGFDEGRLYGEDIDLAYRASKAGWERWYVPLRRPSTPTRPSPTGPSSRAGRCGTGAGSSASSASTPSG